VGAGRKSVPIVSTIVVACPNCKKHLKGPAEIQGKKVRCKACGHSFTVPQSKKGPKPEAKPSPSPKANAPQKVPASATKAAPPAEAPASPGKPEHPPSSDRIALKPTDSVNLPPGSNPAKDPAKDSMVSSSVNRPYNLNEAHQGAKRCPQCAFEMEEEAIICLQCGFNTETRTRLAVVKTYETTPADRAAWLLPGIICALVAVGMVGAIAFIWLLLKRVAQDAWWSHFSIQIYATVFAAFVGWYSGKFAYRRLVKEPVPPEKIKR
jgi:hypothetical protein